MIKENLIKKFLYSERGLIDFGARITKFINSPSIIFLKGTIGAGKTTVVRGFLWKIGITGPIKSPTYSIVQTYLSNGIKINHFDLYRVTNQKEMAEIGTIEYFEDSISFVEWPENGKFFLPKNDFECIINFISLKKRYIEFNKIIW